MSEQVNMATHYEHEIPEGYEARIEGNKVIIELKESEDERVRKEIIDYFYGCIKRNSKSGFRVEQIKGWIAYLEKHKEQEPLSTEETELNSIAFLEQMGYTCIPPKEQKLNIELIQRSWYMEGYHDREFGKEPKWVIKTGEGGPKYEKNEKYGQLLEQKPAEWSEDEMKVLNSIIDDYEKASKSFCGYDGKIRLLKAIRNGEYDLPKQEWSEEDEMIFKHCLVILHDYGYDEWLKSLRPQPSSQPNTNHTIWHNASEEKPTKLPIIHIWYHGKRVNAVVAHENIGLQAGLDDINFQPDDKWAYVEDLLNAQPHWKPSEEQMDALLWCVEHLGIADNRVLESLYNDLKKL